MAKKKEVEEKSAFYDPYEFMDEAIDGIEKDFGLISSGMDKNEKRLSTGLLVLDLIVGKGIVGGGWYTIVGMESCGKSTTASTIMSHCVNSGVPIIQYWDKSMSPLIVM